MGVIVVVHRVHLLALIVKIFRDGTITVMPESAMEKFIGTGSVITESTIRCNVYRIFTDNCYQSRI